MADISLTALRVVRAVIDRGSFSAAAGLLGYTQSAVSRQVALAEEVAGRRLFERGPRGVQATAAGRLVARHADAVLGELESMRSGLAELDGQLVGTVRVGGISSAMAAVVPRAIAAFARQAPAVRVKVREGSSAQLRRGLAAGRIECAVVAEGPAASAEPLFEDPLLVALPRHHRLAGRISVEPGELEGERWIVGSTDPSTPLLGAWPKPSPDALVARDWVAKLGLVAAGQGVTVVPGMAVAAMPADVAVARIDDPGAMRSTWLLVRDDSLARAMAESIRDVAARIASEIRDRLEE